MVNIKSLVYPQDWIKAIRLIKRKDLLKTILAVLSLSCIPLFKGSIFALMPAVIVFFVCFKKAVFRVLVQGVRSTYRGSRDTRLYIHLVPMLLYITNKHSYAYYDLFIVTVVALMPLVESVFFHFLYRVKIYCKNLPGISINNDPVIGAGVFVLLNLVTVALAVFSIARGYSFVGTGLFIGVIVTFGVLAAIDMVRRYKKVVECRARLNKAIESYAPKFILYYQAPKNTTYQVAMWIDYLERLNEPFIVILRLRHDFDKVCELTNAPVIVRRRIIDLDDVLVPSLTTVFYVNNGMYNMHMVRVRQLWHVQLLHGDSDKESSYNPVTQMYDKVFVAGQAAIDRYKNNGVNISIDKFEIVGRPQLEVLSTTSSNPVSSVLYAPTWKGWSESVHYCSLRQGVFLVDELIKREITIIFRPHPYAYKDFESKGYIFEIHRLLEEDSLKSGRKHIWGSVAESDMSVFDCFNVSDAMISDVSSVVSDYLYSGKPFGIMAISASGADFLNQFPMSRAAYVIESDLSNMNDMLDDILYSDSLKEKRWHIREYYLGPVHSDHYANEFIDAARQVINSRKPLKVGQKHDQTNATLVNA